MAQSFYRGANGGAPEDGLGFRPVRVPSYRLGALGFVLMTATLSCRASSSNDEPTIVTSHEALCAGQSPEYSDGTVMSVSCPFLEQEENVGAYGEALDHPTELRDALGKTVARITYTCDTWAMGKDSDGVDVIIRRDSGDVVSHGLVHPGQPISKLGQQLRAPLLLH